MVMGCISAAIVIPSGTIPWRATAQVTEWATLLLRMAMGSIWAGAMAQRRTSCMGILHVVTRVWIYTYAMQMAVRITAERTAAMKQRIMMTMALPDAPIHAKTAQNQTSR